MVAVRDWMTEDPLTVRAGDSAGTVLALMEEHGIRHVPVVDADGELVGLVSDRDLGRRVLGAMDELPVGEQRSLLEMVRVDEIMVHGVVTVDVDAELAEVGEMLIEYKFGCVPVAEGSRLVGIITETDFIRFAIDALAEGRS
jgi:CBS domain-containing membrane protein